LTGGSLAALAAALLRDGGEGTREVAMANVTASAWGQILASGSCRIGDSVRLLNGTVPGHREPAVLETPTHRPTS